MTTNKPQTPELEKVAEKCATDYEDVFILSEDSKKDLAAIKERVLLALHEVADPLVEENQRLIKLIQDKKFDHNHLKTVLDYCPICTCDTLKKELDKFKFAQNEANELGMKNKTPMQAEPTADSPLASATCSTA